MNSSSQAEMRPVVVGNWHGNDWFINEGLASGDRVIVDGAQRLAPGSALTVTDAAEPKATSSSTATTSH